MQDGLEAQIKAKEIKQKKQQKIYIEEAAEYDALMRNKNKIKNDTEQIYQEQLKELINRVNEMKDRRLISIIMLDLNKRK